MPAKTAMRLPTPVPGARGQAALYALDPSYEFGEDVVGYAVVSDNGMEAVAFPATGDGVVHRYRDMAAFRYDQPPAGDTHAVVLGILGYTVEGAR